MADWLDPAIADAFCDVTDIEDVTKDAFDDESEPTYTELLRMAVLDANEITMWLALKKHADKTPALVSATSIEGKALRRLNALRVSREILRDRRAEARSPAAPSIADLNETIQLKEDQLLAYFKSLAGQLTTLGTDVTDGNTGARVELEAGASEDQTQLIKHDTRF